MKITSAVFIRGIKGDNEVLEDGTPQVAFVGRSNAGKSSLINSLTNSKKLTRASKTPGRTQEINVFRINDTHYFMDLPGYGFAKTKMKVREKLSKLVLWYLFQSKYVPRVVLLVDAEIGPTTDDMEMLHELEQDQRDVVVVLNKVDKIKKSTYDNHIKKLKELFVGHKVFTYSSKYKIGIKELSHELLA